MLFEILLFKRPHRFHRNSSIMFCNKSTVLLALLASALVFQTCESVLFTLTGLAVDSALAMLIFGKFLHIPLILGKRSVDKPIDFLPAHATPEEYLAVAAAMDTAKCLPVAVCVAMARAKSNDTASKFDESIIKNFSNLINDSVSGEITPMSFYIEAAKFGKTMGKVESCRAVSATCKYTLPELRELTDAVSQYQL